MANAKLVAVVVLGVFLVFVIELIRRRKLTFKYAFGWLCAASAALLLAVFDPLISGLSAWCGFELPSNFIFFSLLSGMALLTLLMTVFLCEQGGRNDILAQRIAYLENELRNLKKQSPHDGKQ